MESHTDSIPLSPGDMIGWYRIERPLGRGGFGITYLALDTNLDVQVAIKEYLPQNIAARDADRTVYPIRTDLSDTFSWGLDRFINEARTLALFNHESIVRVMSVFEKNQTAYMIMEYVKGADLTGKLDTADYTHEQDLKALVSPLMDGLEVVHKQGFIHRDIKPANIRIPSDNRPPVLLDFGSARQALTSRTQALTAMVSVGYAPLEQYNSDNAGDQGPWTDIYAFGAVLYRAISGLEPTASTLRVSACVNGRADPLISIKQTARNEYSTEFLDAIDWALCWRVNDRPQSINEWRESLLGREAIHAPSSARYKTRKIEQRTLANDTARNPALSTGLAQIQSRTGRRNTGSPVRSQPTAAQKSSQSSSRAPARTHARTTSPQRPATSRTTSRHTSRHAPQHVTRQVSSKRRRKRTRVTLLSTGCVVLFLGLASSAFLSNQSANAPPSKPVDGRAELVQPQTLLANPASRAAIDTIGTSNNLQAAKPVAPIEANNTLAPAPTRTKTVLGSDVDDYSGSEQTSPEVSSVIVAEAASVATSNSDSVNAERSNIQKTVKEQPLINQPQPETTIDAPAIEAPTQVAMLNPSIDTALDDNSLLSTDESAGLMMEPTRPPAISDTDLGLLSRRFHELKEAIMQRDVGTISRLTENSLDTNQLIFRLFDTFESFEVEVSNITAARSQQLVQAKLEFGYLLRSNGNRQLAPQVLRNMTLKVYREEDSWSQIQW